MENENELYCPYRIDVLLETTRTLPDEDGSQTIQAYKVAKCLKDQCAMWNGNECRYKA